VASKLKGAREVKCVVMQPTFFPWAGYFNLMTQADCFVFLDDVQLEKQSWQTRNRILNQGTVSWISVPVLHKNLDQQIIQTETFEQSRWREKLYRQLQQSYARHEYREDMLALAAGLTEISTTNLAGINISLILSCCEKMNIVPKNVWRSSEMDVPDRRTTRLINICERLGCDEYLSPRGASSYLAQDRFCERSPIKLTFQDFSPMPYQQKSSAEFVSHLSIIDLVANIGWAGAAEYVRGCTQLPDQGTKHD
jgi:hypothetical protein